MKIVNFVKLRSYGAQLRGMGEGGQGISICHQVFCHGSLLAGAGFGVDGRQAGDALAKGRMDNAP